MTDFFSGESPFRNKAIELATESGIDHTAEEVLGPFTEISLKVADAFWQGVFPSAGSNSLHWPYLLGMFALAALLFVLRKGRGAKNEHGVEQETGFLNYLLPKSIYTHLSAKVDVGLYLIDVSLMPIWTLLFLGALAPFVESNVIALLQVLLGQGQLLEQNNIWLALYGFLSFMMADFMFFITHYIMHKTRIGWAFHQVHHSAQVLTPLTRYREHFLVAPFWAGNLAIGLALVSGVFTFLLEGSLIEVSVASVTLYSFVYAATSNFRHYHVSFRFPRWLELWIQSPGMHHTHHSHLEKHWDSNLGLVTSVWDRMFGTLYIAERYEVTPWGLSEKQQAKYTTLTQNLTSPFTEIAAIFKKDASENTPD
jgi:sterol desaturase/sphingolipid hydroxylase (fatty acid hydroxylase superfamily)